MHSLTIRVYLLEFSFRFNKIIYRILCFFCTVHCNIIIQYRPMKCTFLKSVILIFNVDVFSIFQTQRFIFRKMVVYAVMVWYVMHASV